MSDLGLIRPEELDAVLFDMDGVVTDTARAHAAAWQRLFDAYLKRRAEERGEPFVPFDPEEDYRAYVDGRPRFDGVRGFLETRGIALPEGEPDDPPERETVFGLGKRKNGYFREWLKDHRVEVFESTLDLVRALRAAGIRAAVFSASRNAGAVLDNAGVQDLFDAKVDGNDLARLGLPGKPDPAMLLEAASRLGAAPGRTAVVEDAVAGVEAGRRGSFALVIGVDRHGDGVALEAAGAHIVVGDLGELLFETTLDRLPLVWQRMDELAARLAGRRPAAFLDYDGTLAPIVDDPDEAALTDDIRASIARLAERLPVAIVSGRGLDDVRARVGLEHVFYAGSHGFEIAGPDGGTDALEKGLEALPELDRAERELKDALTGIEGHVVERKRFSIAVHYRRVPDPCVVQVERAVERVLGAHPQLRKGTGKKVFQVQPDIDWDKGRAMLWLLERLNLGPGVLPVYIGDDVTDEDAFCTLRFAGIGIAVRGGDRRTAARYALADSEDVRRFLETLAMLAESPPA